MQEDKQYQEGIDGLFQEAKNKPLRDLPRELALYFCNTSNSFSSYEDFKDRYKCYNHYPVERLHDIFYKSVLRPIRKAIAKVHQEKIPANCYKCLDGRSSKCQFDDCGSFKITSKNIGVYIKKYGVFPQHSWRNRGKDVDFLKKVESFAFDLNNSDLQKSILILATILNERKEN